QRHHEEGEAQRRAPAQNHSPRSLPHRRQAGEPRPGLGSWRKMRPMALQRTPMTRPGYNRLRDELERLKRVERPAITRAIAEARAHGDLSENAEYHAAREKQAFTEARINELESKLGTAEVLDPPTSGDRITFGSTVRLEDEDGREARYQIVGSDETDPSHGRI